MNTFLICLCIVLSISTIGFAWFAFTLSKKMLEATKAHIEAITALSALAEIYIVNNRDARGAHGESQAIDNVMDSIRIMSQYWQKFPPAINTLLKAMNSWTERHLLSRTRT